MLARLLNRLQGYERLKHRADRLFLAGEFDRAAFEYGAARSLLKEGDHRASAIDALIRSCERQVDPSLDEAPEEAIPPSLDDLFELAIGEKNESRMEAYRILSPAFRAGYVALVQGLAGRAALLLRKAAAAAPSSFVVHLELGRALSLAGRLEEAREALAVAERLAPSDDEGRVLSAAIHVELGRFDEAQSRLEPLLARGGPPVPEVLFLMGKVLAGLGRVDEALAKFRQTAGIEPRFHEAFLEAGRLRARRGDVESAFQLLSRAAALAPDDSESNRELVSLVLRENLDHRAGLAACDRLMVSDPENRWQYLHWIAELYIRRGWRREARDPLRKALQLVPVERRRERHAIEERLASLAGS